jgi:hypothetical protein
LSRVLKHEGISTKGKLLLAYILAKSIWKYYDSDFMQTDWTTDSIHFMREYRLDSESDEKSEKVDPSNPFFAVPNFESESCGSDEQCFSGDVLHQFPRVLALGVMLAEIGRKTPTTAAHTAESPEAKINDNLDTYKRVLKSPGWPALDVRNEEIRVRFRDAVETCLDPKVFHVLHTGKGESDIDARRDIIYRRVIFPLEQLCKELGVIDKPELVQLLDYAEQDSGGKALQIGPMLLDNEGRKYAYILKCL